MDQPETLRQISPKHAIQLRDRGGDQMYDQLELTPVCIKVTRRGIKLFQLGLDRGCGILVIAYGSQVIVRMAD